MVNHSDEIDRLQEYATNIAQPLPKIRALLIVDSTGNIIVDSRYGAPGVGIDVSDRVYFITHTNNQTDELFIDNPVLSRVDQTWSIPVSLGIWDDTNTFLGVVVALLEPIQFSSSLDTFTDSGINGYIIKKDHTILTALPYDASLINTELIYQHSHNHNHPSDTFITNDLLFIHSDIAPYSLEIVFSQPRSTILQSFIPVSLAVLTIFPSLTIFIIMIFSQQLRQIRRLQQSDEEREKAQQGAIQERNLLRVLIDNVPDYIFIKDLNGRFIETNLAHAQATGLKRDELIGKTALDTFSGELAEKFHSDDNLILQGGAPIINEERQTVDSNGNLRWVLTTKIPLKNNNEIVGLVGISRDITDRLEIEKKRRETERTKVEMEEQRKVIELKERFITTASHNFRTPLTVIQSSTDLLQLNVDKYTKEQIDAKINIIHAHIQNMTNLLDDVLTISKSQAQKMEISIERIDLKEFCNEVWTKFVSFDAGKHQKTFKFDTSINGFEGDNKLLRQVFDNILNNASKYTPNDQAIRCHISDNSHTLIFKIADEGYGIPEADIPHLFTPFHRAQNTSYIKGTGLGLAIVKEFIDLHHGEVYIESEEGKGTTVIIKLPIQTTQTIT